MINPSLFLNVLLYYFTIFSCNWNNAELLMNIVRNIDGRGKRYSYML